MHLRVKRRASFLEARRDAVACLVTAGTANDRSSNAATKPRRTPRPHLLGRSGSWLPSGRRDRFLLLPLTWGNDRKGDAVRRAGQCGSRQRHSDITLCAHRRASLGRGARRGQRARTSPSPSRKAGSEANAWSRHAVRLHGLLGAPPTPDRAARREPSAPWPPLPVLVSPEHSQRSKDRYVVRTHMLTDKTRPKHPKDETQPTIKGSRAHVTMCHPGPTCILREEAGSPGWKGWQRLPAHYS